MILNGGEMLIHPARDDNMSDEEFAEYMKPYEKKMRELAIQYMEDFFVEELKIGYDMGAIFADSNIKYEYLDAFDFISNIRFNSIDVKKVKEKLKEKYSLEITNDNPIKIEKIQL